MLTSSGTTKRLDRLEAAGLIARTPDPTDRRGTLITLTEAGHAALDRTIEAHLDNERELIAALGPREQEQLAALLRKLRRGLPPRLAEGVPPARSNSSPRARSGCAPRRPPREASGAPSPDLAPHRAGRGADHALEGAREGGLGAVAEPVGELGDRDVAAGELVEREVHAPAGDVLHRGLPDERR